MFIRICKICENKIVFCTNDGPEATPDPIILYSYKVSSIAPVIAKHTSYCITVVPISRENLYCNFSQILCHRNRGEVSQKLCI